MENREYLGYWWVEGNPDRTLPGILQYRPSDGITLELIDDFVEGIPQSGQGPKKVDKILGINENGEQITLIDCNRDTSSISNSSRSRVRSSAYRPRLMIEGFAFQSMNPSLHKMKLSYYGIDKWAGLTSPQSDVSDPINPDWISLTTDIPETLTAWRDDIRIELGVHFEVNTSIHESGEMRIQHEFRVRPRQTQVPLREYFDHIDNLKNFVALGLGASVSPRYVRGSVRTPDGQKHDVNIFYQIQSELNTEVNVPPHRMLFRPPDILNSFEKVVNQWYDRREEIDEIYDLYFATVFQNRIYPENHFLSLCHGLESYHRKRFQDTYMIPSDYDNVYDDMMELIKGNPSNVYGPLSSSTHNLRTRHSIPDPFVQSLNDGTIKHANKKSLTRRLNEVISSIEPIVDGLPYSIVGKHRKVANTRNYFAHRTNELKQEAGLGAELIELIWGVQQLIEACLLLEIGIHPSQIETRLKSRYNNRWVE